MNFTTINRPFKSLKIGVSVLALAMMTLTASAQQEEHKNPNVRLGQKALLDGDFKGAITHLEKALPAESNDADVLYLLGYSQFQSGLYQKASESFGKVIALDAKNPNAYYYKAKANNVTAVNKELNLAAAKRAALLESAVADYTKAIALNASDAKLYQNRAIAYRDLAIAKGTEGVDGFDKVAAVSAYNKAITDYEKVLSFDANRKDIQTEIKKAKVYRDLLK